MSIKLRWSLNSLLVGCFRQNAYFIIYFVVVVAGTFVVARE